MASGNKKRFSCGHRGFGKYCHRCEMASTLEALAESGKTYKTHKKAMKKIKEWLQDEMLMEAKRLRAVQ